MVPSIVQVEVSLKTFYYYAERGKHCSVIAVALRLPKE